MERYTLVSYFLGNLLLTLKMLLHLVFVAASIDKIRVKYASKLIRRMRNNNDLNRGAMCLTFCFALSLTNCSADRCCLLYKVPLIAVCRTKR